MNHSSIFSKVALYGLGVILIASCASKRLVSVKEAKSDSELNKFNSNYHYAKDKDGNMVIVYDRKNNPFGDRQLKRTASIIKGGNYQTSQYSKKKWDQQSSIVKSQFQGDRSSDYGGSPYYVKKAIANQQQSRFGHHKYRTQHYKTGAAAVADSKRRNSALSNTQSGYVESQADYPEPLIMTRKQYSKMIQKKNITVKQTNSLLER